MSNDEDSPVQLSVRELRQWLANLGEKHQEHFLKTQVPSARSQERLHQQDSRQSTGLQMKELERITAVKETQQKELSENRDNGGVQRRIVVSYSSEYPAWHLRTIKQEENRMALIETEDNHHQENALQTDESSWTFHTRNHENSRAGSRASRSSYGEGSQALARLDRLSTEETITFHRDSHDSSHDRSTRSFSTKSTLFSDCFAAQIDLEDRWVTTRDERGGVRKSRLVQDRQRALQEKWAQDRQVIHKKKVQWTTLKGGYKKTIVLTEEEEEI